MIAIRITWRGTAVDGGGEIEVPIGFVTLIEQGRELSLDQFDAEDRQGMIARYAELGGGQGSLGDRPPERFWAEFCRRWATRDVDAITELYCEDWVAVEHRQLGWEEMRGGAAAREHVHSILKDAVDFRCEIGEVLACDDRVIALRSIWRGSSGRVGGTFENQYGNVTVIEDGRITRLERFDPDDRDAMLACYEELRKNSVDP